jgi:hypothetical protein
MSKYLITLHSFLLKGKLHYNMWYYFSQLKSISLVKLFCSYIVAALEIEVIQWKASYVE